MERCLLDDPIFDIMGKPEPQRVPKFEPDRIDRLIAAGADKTYFLRGLGIRNPYGCEISISHPRIAPLYEAFKVENKIPYYAPLSDMQRKSFEEEIFAKLTNWAARKEEKAKSA